MKTIAVIPSRYGSTRFPGKSLAPICGKPLVRWVAEACLRAKTVDEVLVATDDERIAAAVEGTGARAVMTPSDLPSGTDRVEPLVLLLFVAAAPLFCLADAMSSIRELRREIFRVQKQNLELAKRLDRTSA